MEIVTLLLSSTLLVAVLLFLFRKDSDRARLHRMIAKIPGPPALPLVGNVVPFLFLEDYEAWRKFQTYLSSHQPLLRFWSGSTPFVVVYTPELLEVILNNYKTIDKPFVYKFLHPWLGTGLLTATGTKWHSRRKLLTPSFHFKILENFVEIFSEKSQILVKKLQQEAGRQIFNVHPYITCCALDIICETAMGTSVNAQEDATSDYVTAVNEIAHAVRHRTVKPWLHPDWLFRLSSYGRTHDRCLKVLHSFTNKVIRERKLQRQYSQKPVNDSEFTEGKKRPAFLDMLLDVSEGGTKLTDEEIREEVDTFMFEGHHTATSAMCFALFLLGLHPDVQKKAYEEQEIIFQGSDRSATMKDLNEMKYLEMIIKEALRLYPSVPEIARKLKNDIQLGGYTVPAGVVLVAQIFFLHRNPAQFPNPEKFDPDNFLPERVEKRHPYAYIPFSAGPRNCIGQKFALLEEKTVLSCILRHYEMRSLDKREDMKIHNALILRSEEGFKVSMTRRNECVKK